MLDFKILKNKVLLGQLKKFKKEVRKFLEDQERWPPQGNIKIIQIRPKIDCLLNNKDSRDWEWIVECRSLEQDKEGVQVLVD